MLLLPTVLGLLSYWLTSPTLSPDAPIFRAGRTYVYQALFISPHGDTLSRERVTIIAMGHPWKLQKKVQTALAVQYAYSRQDSLTFLTYPNPLTKKPTQPKRFNWVKSVETGAIETPQQVWMHPLRDNQYVSTEIAPYPLVKLDSLVLNGVWHQQLAVMMGWGAFKGKTVSRYRVVKRETRRYGSLMAANCWLIQAESHHSQLGTSYLDFYFHPNYGFMEMRYRFYDGTRISFLLAQVSN